MGRKNRETSWYLICLSYLKIKCSLLGILLVFVVTFWVVSILYHLPMEPFWYSLLLSSTLTILLITGGMVNYYKKHNQLYQIRMEENVVPYNLPTANNLVEEDYIEIIRKQFNYNRALLSEADARETELMDYYTMWAHQIKVPISAIGLLLQTDHQDIKSEPIKQELFKVEQYVEMVLHYLRIESMSSDLLLKEYDLYDLIKQAVRKYSVLFIYKKITLQMEEFSCKVITDEKWLVFVLEQILSNAIKYTKTGTIFISLDENIPKTLVIEDTGIGIQQEDIPRIFDRGFTGYNGRMDKKSTGIGLYLTKRILSKLSHTIQVTSQVGKGTRVSIGLESAHIEVE